MKKRLLSLLLALVLVVGMLPVSALAEEDGAVTTDAAKDSDTLNAVLTLKIGAEELTDSAILLEQSENELTGNLPVYTSTEEYNVTGFVLNCPGLPDNTDAKLIFAGNEYPFTNKTADTGSEPVIAAAGNYSGQIIVGSETLYSLKLTKENNNVRFTTTLSGNIFVGTPDFSANIFGHLEGTPFQMDDEGNLTDNGGIAPECFDYHILVSDSISAIKFSKGLDIFKLLPKKNPAQADFYINGEKIVSGSDCPTPMAFAMKVCQKSIELKDTETEFSFVLWGENAEGTEDKKVTTTYRFHVTKLSEALGASPQIDAVDPGEGAFSSDEGFIPTVFVTDIDRQKSDTTLNMTFSVADGVSLYRGAEKNPDTKLTANSDGKYTVEVPTNTDFLITASTTLTLNGKSMDFNVVYTFKFHIIGELGEGTHEPNPPLRDDVDIVDRIIDYVPAPSGYTTDYSAESGMHDGIYQGVTAWSRFSSIGAFGGYMTFAFDNPIVNDPHNPYGIDFIVYGNGYGFNKEPGGVLVSEDGKTWYTLAGSMHYELTTDWSVPSKKLINGKIVQSVQIAKDEEGKTANVWPLLPIFGYADNYQCSGNANAEGSYKVTAEAGNPYNAEAAGHIIGDGFDLTWAVDETGKPVQLNQVTYIRVQNVTDIKAYGVFSPEIGTLARAKASDAEVGVTAPLSSLTVNGQELIGAAPQKSTYNGAVLYYELDLQDKSLAALQIQAKGQKDDAIVINNERYIEETESTLLLDKDGSRMLRVIVQNGECEPVSYIIKCTGGGDPSANSSLDWLKLNPGDITRKVGNDAEISFEVANNVENIKLTASALNPNSGMTLSGGTLDEAINLTYRDSSPVLKLQEGENVFSLTVQAVDNLHSTVYRLVINRSPASSNSYNVKFCFTGDTIHGSDASGHTVQTWIREQTVSVPKGSTVKYLTDMMLYNAGIEFDDTDGTYISSVMSPTEKKWLSEFSNGANSGWMYRYNGKIADEGYAARVLEDGASILWFYTDDYTKEADYEDSWTSSGGAGTKSEEEKVTTELKPSATISNGEASASVSVKDMSDAIADAKQAGAKEIVIAPEVKGEASKVSVELPKISVDAIAKQTGAGLKVETGIADITIPTKGLNGLAQGEGSAVSVSAEVIKDSGGVKIEIAVDGRVVEKLDGGIAVTIPTEENAGNVLVRVKADGTEEVVKKSVTDGKTVSALLDGSATVKLVDNSKAFTDTAGHWAKEAVAFASSHELFNGVAEGIFAPDAPMSRAMLATVLYRLEGAAANGGSPFADVAEGTWYTDAVLWASAENIVSGTGDGFAPDRDITRQELVTMLYRYAKSIGLDTGSMAKLDDYTDGGGVADWAGDAMSWAVGNGLVSGRTSTTLAPSGTATRAEVAAVMQRLVALMVK